MVSRAISLLLVTFVLGCATEVPPPMFDVVDRLAGDRTPRIAGCEGIDDARCLLPWPSNTFSELDPSTETGLRLAVPVDVLNPRDEGSSLSLADGFSRVTPLLAHFPAPLAEDTLRDGISLILVQQGHPERGSTVPLRVETLELAGGQTLFRAGPMQVLEPSTDYLVVITDSLVHEGGAPVMPTRGTSLALALAEPETQEEADLVGYHAPSRAYLSEAAIEPTTVVRLWDFTTRSAAGPRAPIESTRAGSIAAVDAGSVTATVTRVEMSPDPSIAMILIGELDGLPDYLDEDRGYFIGPGGLPEARATISTPFRVVVPAGTGDYRFVMYGHGTGGNHLDDAFDAELARAGIAKVNVRFTGWTDIDVLLTFSNLQRMTAGSFGAAAYLVQGLAHAAGVQRAMTGVIGDLLAADVIDGAPNVAAGRRPDGSRPMWVGGSMGGTVGVIYAAADPEIRYAVVNVPGAAWAQWVWHSATFDLIHGLLSFRYEDDIDLATALAIGQTNLDLADGASWVDVLAENPTAYLVQESMGDPVLPNPGTEMVAVVTGAVHIGGILEPIAGVEPQGEVIDSSGITQFQAPPGDIFEVHGFAARDTPVGAAAREQIFEFVTTALEGSSRIVPPPSCPVDGCEFAP